MPPKGATIQSYSGYFSIVAWILVILLFVAIAKTKIGYTLLFFFIVSSIIVVIAVGSPTIASIFGLVNPLNAAGGGGTKTVK